MTASAEQQDVAVGLEPVGERMVHPRTESTVPSRVEIAHPELVTQVADLWQRGVVHNRDREPSDRLQSAAQQAWGAECDDNHLRVRAVGNGAARHLGHPSVDRLVLPCDGCPGAAPCPLDAGRPEPLPEPRVPAHPQQRLSEGVRVPFMDEESRVPDHVGEGTAVAADHRDAGGHRLDHDPAELLDPAWRRQRRDGQDVHPLQKRRQLLLGRWSVEGYAAPGARRAGHTRRRSSASCGPAPTSVTSRAGYAATVSSSTSTPLCAASRPT